MTTDDGNRLSRWSRRKQQAARGEALAEPEEAARVLPGQGAAAPVPATVSPAGTDGDSADGDDERELTAEEAAYVETLPPVEELNGESDFAAFLDKRVPEFIKRKALRKLWLSDPAFSFLDGMNEYDEDYSVLVELAAGASAYRPGEGGYAWRDKPKTDPEDDEIAAQGEAETDGEAPQASVEQESIADKSARVQGRGDSDVRARTYTANPYYQAPGQRMPAPETLAQPVRPQESFLAEDDDDLGDAEDDFA